MRPEPVDFSDTVDTRLVSSELSDATECLGAVEAVKDVGSRFDIRLFNCCLLAERLERCHWTRCLCY